MKITDVKVRRYFDEGPLRAIVSITLDNQLAVHDVKVVNASGKSFIVMPSKKNPDGTFRDVVHPTNSEFRKEIEKTVLDSLERFCSENNPQLVN